MKRLLTTLGLIGLLGFGVPTAAQAEAGPACADITDGGGLYTAIGYDQPTFEGYITLAGKPCSAFEYRIVVRDEAGTTTLASSDAYTVDPVTGNLHVPVTVPDGPQFVCAYAEVTTPGGGHVFDRGPDAGCGIVALDPDDGGGGSGWR